jgi:arylsulfatase A-like enzyme
VTVLDTLEEAGLMDKTIVLRFADHGAVAGVVGN